MSVHSEFQRILQDLVAFLERTGATHSERWIRELRTASATGHENVAEGATLALALLHSEGPTPDFTSPLEIEDFARLQEHLSAICRVVLGG